MDSTSSVSCSLCSTPCYPMPTEQAESNVVDDQSPNALAADSDSVGVCVGGAFSFMILFQFEILSTDFIMSEL